jgi:flagellar secretion chaperone FliS
MKNMSTANVSALKQYMDVGLRTGIDSASPHKLIQMLLDGALARVAQAKGHISAAQSTGKGENISMAISIIGGLRDSLDHKQGGSIADNLDSLYEYMTYRLMEANMKDDITILNEVHDLLVEIKTGWDGIANNPEVTGNNHSQIEPAA